MKKALICISFISILSILVAFNRESDGPIFKGEGEYWSAELITQYSFWGKETQSIRVKYKGEEKNLTDTNLILESPDFLGWGINKIDVDENGLYNSGAVFELDSKTSSSSNITLRIEGQDSESFSLSANPL